ncbi:hypothetical protein [uncultured Amnibacterium sp.]|uniref:hypothetical protein n=1 Tax=uncultured Amnibacterium sp. TaxID=1631851 RepID=UPI0035CB1992
MHRIVLALVTVAGVVTAGIGLWFSTDRRPASFGWTAYSPLSSTAHPFAVGPPWWSLALIAIGCLAVGSAVTTLVTRRRNR